MEVSWTGGYRMTSLLVSLFHIIYVVDFLVKGNNNKSMICQLFDLSCAANRGWENWEESQEGDFCEGTKSSPTAFLLGRPATKTSIDKWHICCIVFLAFSFIRYQLRVRYFPKDLKELYTRDKVTFFYLYDQVLYTPKCNISCKTVGYLFNKNQTQLCAPLFGLPSSQVICCS